MRRPQKFEKVALNLLRFFFQIFLAFSVNINFKKRNSDVTNLSKINRVDFAGANKARIYGQENLYKALEGRPKDTPLITVTNHHSCMDEPLIWGCLKNKHLTNNSLMRWALAAHDICFSNKFHALFFAFGKSIPIVRGDGPNQVLSLLLFLKKKRFKKLAWIQSHHLQ